GRRLLSGYARPVGHSELSQQLRAMDDHIAAEFALGFRQSVDRHALYLRRSGWKRAPTMPAASATCWLRARPERVACWATGRVGFRSLSAHSRNGVGPPLWLSDPCDSCESCDSCARPNLGTR